MNNIVTNMVGLNWIMSVLVMSMTLFTSVGEAYAGDNKGPVKQSVNDEATAASKFDAAKWLELYKKNGWDKSKFVRSSQERSNSILPKMSPDAT